MLAYDLNIWSQEGPWIELLLMVLEKGGGLSLSLSTPTMSSGFISDLSLRNRNLARWGAGWMNLLLSRDLQC